MKILSAEQIKEQDKFTIRVQKITSLDLMERAATACFNWMIEKHMDKKPAIVFCGKGNNGGDGLAIARLLLANNNKVRVYIIESANDGSPDFTLNLEKLQAITKNIATLREGDPLPPIGSADLVLDAIFGTGLNRNIDTHTERVLNHINSSPGTVISIDLPSGMFADRSGKLLPMVKASYTLSFHAPKLAFMMPENAEYIGALQILDIGIDSQYEDSVSSPNELLDMGLIRSIYKPRKSFAHKGDYGHARMIAGSYGMMGAAVLSVKACLVAGAGKVTSIIPKEGYEIMQISVPEAMAQVLNNEEGLNANGGKFTVTGIGPGLGINEFSSKILRQAIEQTKNSMVLDADALNMMAKSPELLLSLPSYSVLTPHPKEFDNLFGNSGNDFERMHLATKKAAELNCYIVLKGHRSLIVTPFKKVYFNTTGNPGMAKGGSGDVLTGIITGLLCCGYPSLEASLLGVYLHGLAGDHASDAKSQESILASDIINNLGSAFKSIAEK